MTEIENQETRETVAKMVSALRKHGEQYAAGYLESFIAGLIEEYVADRSELAMIQMRMLKIGIDHLIDAPRSK